MPPGNGSRRAALALGAALWLAAAAAGSVELPEAGARQLADLRAVCASGPLEQEAEPIDLRGRAALEVRARAAGADLGGKMREFAVFDLAAQRVVSFVCFANASTRRQGEAIVSISEASGRADGFVRRLMPGAPLDLESVERYRASGLESVYYEARYTFAQFEFPRFEPPVRLLLNASTGSLFKFDVDPTALEEFVAPRSRISRQAAERIAGVVLRGRDLAPEFGAGVAIEKIGAAELFVVRPNDWLGLHTGAGADPNRLAWVVPVGLAGAERAAFSLFVDAATGRVLGGAGGRSPALPQ